VRQIGVLMGLAESDPEAEARVVALREELKKLGWTEGLNIRIEYRWSNSDSNSTQLSAKQLVALQPDVIITHATPATVALHQETRSIPIVFVQVSDPVGSGLIASLARPGGNATGFIAHEGPMAGKWLELLKEIAPRTSRVAFLFNPRTAPGGGTDFLNAFKAAAVPLGVEATAAPVHDISEIETVIAAQAREPNGGLIAAPDAFLSANRLKIVSLADRYRLPAVYPFRYFAEIGGLLSYGNDPIDMVRRSASYVDRILRGERPSELPAQFPVKFELVINLKTAKALGLDVSWFLQQRADEVIE
jgi:putative ABC transport system substrate-binding protein